MKEYFEDYVKMQAELPAVMKSAQGQAGQGKFKYADLPEIVATIRPILSKFGFAYMQPLATHEGETYLRTVLIHKCGHVESFNVRIEYKGDDIKKFGAAVTYYRRYALNAMLGLVADEDADDVAETIPSASKKAPNDEDLFQTFYSENVFGYSEAQVRSFFKARSGYNKRTIAQNIADFNGKAEAFLKELTSWLSKQG